MPYILPNQRSVGGLLVADASGRDQSHRPKKEAEQGAEMDQLMHLPPGDHGVQLVGESGRLPGRTIHW